MRIKDTAFPSQSKLFSMVVVKKIYLDLEIRQTWRQMSFEWLTGSTKDYLSLYENVPVFDLAIYY